MEVIEVNTRLTGPRWLDGLVCYRFLKNFFPTVSQKKQWRTSENQSMWLSLLNFKLKAKQKTIRKQEHKILIADGAQY